MPLQLLIADDSVLIRSSLRRLVSSVPGVGHIGEAATLAETLQSVERDRPSLVILDLNLPDDPDLSLIVRLKQRFPTLMIAVLTLYASPGYRQHCQTLGADWFFDKACDIDDLLKTVGQLALLSQTRLLAPTLS